MAILGKMSLENRHFLNGDYFEIISPYSHSTLLAQSATTVLVKHC